MSQTFYEVLGVAENVEPDALKRAYRSLAKKFHPDATGGDRAKEARFKEITEAWETLSNREKRLGYDRKLALQRQAAEAARRRQPEDIRSAPFSGKAVLFHIDTRQVEELLSRSGSDLIDNLGKVGRDAVESKLGSLGKRKATKRVLDGLSELGTSAAKDALSSLLRKLSS